MCLGFGFKGLVFRALGNDLIFYLPRPSTPVAATVACAFAGSEGMDPTGDL